jgi:glycine cleavage system pyridoxal-binding protein P
MTFNPHTTQDRAEMLAAIGTDTVESLFTAIPSDVRFPTLELPGS